MFLPVSTEPGVLWSVSKTCTLLPVLNSDVHSRTGEMSHTLLDSIFYSFIVLLPLCDPSSSRLASVLIMLNCVKTRGGLTVHGFSSRPYICLEAVGELCLSIVTRLVLTYMSPKSWRPPLWRFHQVPKQLGVVTFALLVCSSVCKIVLLSNI